MEPEVQWFQQSEGPVQVQVTEVSAVHVVQQVAQQLAPLVEAIAQVEAGFQSEQTGPPGDQVVGVVVHPRLPPVKLTVGNQQSLLTQMEDAAAGIVRHSPQLPGADKAAPEEADQSAAAFVHLTQEGQDVQLALHRQEVKGKVFVRSFPPATHGDQRSFPWRHDDRSQCPEDVRISSGWSCGPALP